MPDQTSTIISKVWGMCNPLRDDGIEQTADTALQ